MPQREDVHLAMDNYATQKTPKIRAWLARRPHWHARFTPTSASRIDRVERWFAEPTRKRLQRGVHRSTADLEADIAAFIDAHNDNSKPCRWVNPPTKPSRHQTLPPANTAEPMWRTLDSGG